MAPAKRAARAVGFAVVLLATAASAQDHPAGAFKVRWEPRGAGGVPMIDGLVHNDSPYRVTNVRLQIEGLDVRLRILAKNCTGDDSAARHRHLKA